MTSFLGRMAAPFQNERTIVGALSQIVFRVFAKSSGKAHGLLLGYPGAIIPLGSRISGTSRITIEEDFRSLGPIWIEAVTHYAGEEFTPNISIGRGFRSTDRVHIAACDSVEIGQQCLFGSDILITDHSHGHISLDEAKGVAPADQQLVSKGRVRIGDRCWLGDGVRVLAGVSIGDDCIVGTGSVVTKDLPNGVVVAGIPARVVRSRSDK